MAVAEGSKDFFVSYTGADRRWAEWVAWVLEEAGHTVVLQAWDFHVGENFIANMHRALEATIRTLAVLSPAYCASTYCQQEWTAALAKAGQDGADRLLPVRIVDFAPPGLFAPIAYLDLVGIEEGEARGRLLAGVKQTRAKPETIPPFPGSYGRAVVEKPRFPGALPPVWNLPHRNPHFTGREELIEQLHRNLTAGTATAIHGLDGVGKTQLAMEYAYRFKDDYDVAWWLRAEDAALLAGDCTALARALDLPEKDAREQAIVIEAVRRWLEGHGRWLLVYDNAEDPKVVRDALPRAPTGHVLITSRNPAWGNIADTLPLDRWPRKESVRFLRERSGKADDRAADRVAEALGDLPLALEQAAAYCEQTGTTLSDYADLLEQGYGAELWREPRDLERTVAAVWEMSFSKVGADSPAAAALLTLCAFLAPDNIPLEAIRDGPAELPEPLQGVATRPVAFNSAVGALLRFSLARRDGEALSVHRLVQAVTRNRLTAEEHGRWAERSAALINAALPGFPHDAFDAGIAALYDRLQPHALAAAEHAEGQGVALEAAARLFNDVGFYRSMRADLAAARAAYQRALAIDEKAFGPDHPSVAIGVNNLGMVLKDLGDLDGARKAFERALAIDEKAFGPDHPSVARGVNNLGMVLKDLGDLDGARKAFERALAIDEKAFGPDHPNVARDINNLGGVLKDLGDLDGARKAYQRALAIDEKAFGPDHPSVAIDVNNLGSVLHDLGDLDGARKALERAMAIDEKAFGPDHPSVAIRVNNLGSVLHDLGDLDGARKAFERALAIDEKAFGPDHPNVARDINNLGGVLKDLGDLDGARKAYQRALAIDEKAFHPSVAIDVNNLGMVLKDLGDLDGARKAFERAMAIDEKAFGPDHPSVARGVNNLGSVLHDLGDLDGARKAFERAMAIDEKAFGPDHPNVARDINNLGGVLKDLGDLDGARKAYQRALAIIEKALGPDHPHAQAVRSNLAALRPR